MSNDNSSSDKLNEQDLLMAEALIALCERFGWSLERDNYGQIMFYTGLTYADENGTLRELDNSDLF